MGRKSLTHEEFMERFYIKNETAENIEILGKYKGNKIKIKCKCKIDGYEWETIPNTLLKGIGCPKCGIEKAKNSRKLTHEEFLEKFYKQNKNAENIEILGEYVKNNIKIKVRCKIDGYEWEVKPNNLLNNQGCPKCYGNIKKTTEEFKREMKEINKNIEVLGEYINDKTKIKCRCKKDGYEWEARPNSLLNGQGCPKCYGNIRKTTEEFINELKEVNGDIEVLGEYVNNKTKIKCRCRVDGYIWEMTPNNLLNNQGCPKCNESKGEKAVAKYLDSRNIKYESQYKFNDCKSKTKLPFDFYIPSKNIVIEYDGRQHFELIDYFGGFNSFVEGKIRDTIKTIYCKENNIKLIRIAYWDFDNIEKILEKEL